MTPLEQLLVSYGAGYSARRIPKLDPPYVISSLTPDLDLLLVGLPVFNFFPYIWGTKYLGQLSFVTTRLSFMNSLVIFLPRCSDGVAMISP